VWVDVEARIGLRFWRRDGAGERLRLEQQFAELWSEFGASLTRLASTYEAHSQGREDLLQDIRLAIWMALPRFRSESSLRTFVFRIAHNRALTYMWQKKKTDVLTSIEGLELPDQEKGPESVTLEKVDLEQLMAAIRALPMPMMQVISLALEELPHKEIAEVLGLTENNVAVRLSRARTLLRQKLGEME